MNYISFPGLGIDEFPLKKTAFSLLGHDIMWYGVIISIGIILGVLYVLFRAKYEDISGDDVIDYAIYLTFFGVIGARLYYVIMEFDSYKGKDIGQTLFNILAIWEGGLAIYGGIIAGAIALITVSFIKKIKLGRAFDMIAPAVMLGQIIGRWGNFTNAEAHGGETSLPFRMGIRAEGSSITEYVHPTFLYESLWNLVGFILINIFYKKKKYDGQIFIMYLTWYGFGRMFIEGLRTDSLYVGDFRISQVVAFLCFFFGLATLVSMEIVIRLRNKAQSTVLCEGECECEGENEVEVETEEVTESEITEETTEPEATKETTESEITEETTETVEETAETNEEKEETNEHESFDISDSYADESDEEE